MPPKTLKSRKMTQRRWGHLVRTQPPHPLLDDPPHQAGTGVDLARCSAVLADVAGKSLLDVGCGDGWTVRQFIDTYRIDAYGLTISPQDVEDGRAKLDLGERITRGDMHSIPFASDGFEMVWCRHALEHAIAPYVALLEFNRVLTAGGHLFVGMPLSDGPWVEAEHHFWVPTRKQANVLFERAGFRIEDEWIQEHGTGQQSYLLRRTRMVLGL